MQRDLREETENHKQSRVDVSNRDEVINQLEKILENATSRYAAKMHEEQVRLKTNIHIRIQANPSVCNFKQQVDFVLVSPACTVPRI